MTIRQEVLEHIIDVMRTAEERGEDGAALASAAFPYVPQFVLGEAIGTLMQRQAEEWWQSVERTIDGKIIEAALALPNKTGGAA